jgi:hypothetical protein
MPAVVERTGRYIGRRGQTDCMSSSVARSNCDWFFPVGTSDRAHLCSPSQDNRRCHGQNSNSCDNSQFQHVKARSRECRVADALSSASKRTEAASNNYCNYEATMVWSCDSFRHLTAMCILKTVRPRTYVVQRFVLFLTRNHTIRSLFANCFSFWIMFYVILIYVKDLPSTASDTEVYHIESEITAL